MLSKKNGILLLVVIIIAIVSIMYLLSKYYTTTTTHEGFASPLAYGMRTSAIGKYDGLVLTDDMKEYPFMEPSNVYTNTYQGFSGPLTNNITSTLDIGDEAPSVDGTLNAPKDMFMFAYNQCRPECCPSAFSCDRGCVCLTDEQKKLLSYRGTNSTYCTSTLTPTNGQPVGMFGITDDY